MNDFRVQFNDLYSQITREGADKLYNDFLVKSDFFEAPASTRHHLARVGGLLEHSVNVASVALQLNGLFSNQQSFNVETLVICGLLHDICKANYYGRELKNVKGDDGKWTKEEVYCIKDKFPYGHGEKSVQIITNYMKLTGEEMLAIRWHMGKWDLSEYHIQTYNNAQAKTKLITFIQIADMAASHLVEA